MQEGKRCTWSLPARQRGERACHQRWMPGKLPALPELLHKSLNPWSLSSSSLFFHSKYSLGGRKLLAANASSAIF